ncbi:MAG: hypothetical protein U0610_28970 [bacterium]
MTEQTLVHWVRTASPSIRPVTIATASAPVEVAPALRSERPVLVLASGHRVEGLDVEQLVALIRVLA